MPLAKDKLLLSSCLPVSKGRICKSGVCCCGNEAAAAVRFVARLPQLLLIVAGVEHAEADSDEDDVVVKANGVDNDDIEAAEEVAVEAFVVVLADVVVKH